MRQRVANAVLVARVLGKTASHEVVDGVEGQRGHEAVKALDGGLHGCVGSEATDEPQHPDRFDVRDILGSQRAALRGAKDAVSNGARPDRDRNEGMFARFLVLRFEERRKNGIARIVQQAGLRHHVTYYGKFVTSMMPLRPTSRGAWMPAGRGWNAGT